MAGFVAGCTALMRGGHVVGIGMRHGAKLRQQQRDSRKGGNAQLESMQKISQCRPHAAGLPPSLYKEFLHKFMPREPAADTGAAR
jgi:hypothetical protein